MNFAQVLRDSRQLGGLTQSQLSTRSGINQSVISAYERGRREPGAETFLMLIEAAGLDREFELLSLLCQHPMVIGNFNSETATFRSFADLTDASY